MTLSDNKRKLYRKIYSLRFVLWALGLVSVLLQPFLPHSIPIKQYIFTDENALLPGSSTLHILENDNEIEGNKEHDLEIGEDGKESGIKKLMKYEKAIFSLRRKRKGSVQQDIASQIYSQFKYNLGLDTANYIYKHDDEQQYQRNNNMNETTHIVYGILRTARTDGKECLVVVVDYEENSFGEEWRANNHHTSGLALVMRLAQYLSKVNWLSRDIIFVTIPFKKANFSASLSQISPKRLSQKAFESWLDSYHLNSINFDQKTDSHNEFKRAGNIVAAICLDLNYDYLGNKVNKWSQFSLLVGGPYGILPNLDIVSVITSALRRQELPLIISDTFRFNSLLSPKRYTEKFAYAFSELQQPDFQSVDGVLNFFQNLVVVSSEYYRTMVRFALNVALGHGCDRLSYHGHFSKYNIDALTIQAVPEKESDNQQDFHSSNSLYNQRNLYLKFASALEDIIRPLSNIIEKLHHSTYLYFLISPYEFVTFSKYFPSFVVMGIPILIEAFYQYFSYHKTYTMQLKRAKKLANVDLAKSLNERLNRSIYSSLIVLGVVYLTCFMFWKVPLFIDKHYSILLNLLRIDESVSKKSISLWHFKKTPFIYLTICTLIYILMMISIRFLLRKTFNKDNEAQRYLKSIFLIAISIFCFPLSIINWPLIWPVLAFLVPLLLWVKVDTDNKNSLSKSFNFGANVVKFLVLTLFSPPLIYTSLNYLWQRLTQDVSSYNRFQMNTSNFNLFSYSVFIQDTNNLAFIVLFLVYLPTWTLCLIFCGFSVNKDEVSNILEANKEQNDNDDEK